MVCLCDFSSRYSIDKRSDTAKAFKIDPNNGTITVAKALDRETTAWHNVTAGAKETSKESFTLWSYSNVNGRLIWHIYWEMCAGFIQFCGVWQFPWKLVKNFDIPHCPSKTKTRSPTECHLSFSEKSTFTFYNEGKHLKESDELPCSYRRDWETGNVWVAQQPPVLDIISNQI